MDNGITVHSNKALKNCPFCGEYPVIMTDGAEFYIAKCATCDAIVVRQFASDMRIIGFTSEEQAVQAWNRRKEEEVGDSHFKRVDSEIVRRSNKRRAENTKKSVLEALQAYETYVSADRITSNVKIGRESVKKYLNELSQEYPEHIKVMMNGWYKLWKWED